MRRPSKPIALAAGVVMLGTVIGGGASTAYALFTDTETDPAKFSTAASFITTYYLHDNPTPPTADQNAQANLTLNANAPTAATLFNYDVNRDAAAGLQILKGGSGPDETTLSRYQNWRTGVLSSPRIINGTVTVTFWSGIKNFATSTAGEVNAYLRDFNPTNSTYAEIANTTLTVANWQDDSGTWVSKTLNIAVSNYTVPAGHRLGLKFIVGSGAGNDMWFAYDTTVYPSRFTIPSP